MSELTRIVSELGPLPSWFLINGKRIQSSGHEELPIIDPGSGRRLTTVPAATISDMDHAVSAARSALHGPWADITPKARGYLLWSAGEAITKKREYFARVETLDSGKPLKDALVSVDRTADYFRYYAGMVDKLEGTSIPLGNNKVCFTEKTPIGVTGHIVPWNVPMSMVARGIAPALACGNTAVVKPAEDTPLAALLLAELLESTGLPPGVVNVVTGLGDQVGHHLAAHPDVGHITFTGSVATGKKIMKAAADHLASVTLELGGKSPHLLLADARLEQALPEVINGAYKNAGQICSAGTRLLVEEPIHQQVVDSLATTLSDMTIGHGLTHPDLGPLISARQFQRVVGFMERAVDQGAKVQFGGSPAEVDGYPGGFYFQPTLVDRVAPDSELGQSEVFGPVLSVIPVKNLKHAIELANDTDYGLAAGIQTQNIDAALRYAREVDAGQVYVNGYHNAGDTVPFGGMKHSGVGREKGLEALNAYCEIKAVTISL